MPHLTVNDYITIIGFLVALEMAIGHGTVSLTNAVPAAWIPIVQAWCNILAFIGASMVTALSRFAAILIIAALTLLLAAPAMAQGKFKPTGNLPADIKNAIGGQPQGSNEGGGTAGGATKDQLGQLLSKPFVDIANFIGDDIDGAITLSTQIPSLQDGNGQQCWMALKDFGSIIKVHPLPLTGKAITDLEAGRLLVMAANRLCLNSHCTQVFADLAGAVQSVGSLAPIGTGGIPVPSLNTLCSHVPQVAVVAPVQVPATPTATPVPATPTPATPQP
jgi:hypothetical protein